MIRQLLVIIRYELLMQIKSMRFKGICLFAIFLNVIMYMNGVRQQNNITEYFLPSHEFVLVFFYMASFVLAGLFSIGRLRKAGMHSILMVRPFPTFSWMFGQMVAAVISALIPLFIFFFPSGLLLRWQYDVEFPIPPFLYIILFYMLPAAASVISLTIWIRACFKSNMVAIIAISFIFAAATSLARTPLLNVPGFNGNTVHNFVPMVSYFSPDYWKGIRFLWQTPRINFFNFTPWLHLTLTIAYSTIFLILACYHLRRTEPHRKVLGTYGRKWFHAPTFLKMACDMKIDPHMTWRTHVILSIFILVILGKIVIPLWQPDLLFASSSEEKSDDRQNSRQQYIPAKGTDLKTLRDDQILRVKIHRENVTVDPRDCSATLQISFTDDPTSKTAFFVNNIATYIVKNVSIDGKKIPFRTSGSVLNYEISGTALAPYGDGAQHSLAIQSSVLPNVDLIREVMGMIYLSSLAYSFPTSRIPAGENGYYLDKDTSLRVPSHFILRFPAETQIIMSPVDPVEIPGNPKSFLFDVPYGRCGWGAHIGAMVSNDYDIIPLDRPTCHLRFVIHKENANIFKEYLDMAGPVMEEFCSMQRIDTLRRPLLVRFEVNDGGFQYYIRMIKRFHLYYQRRGKSLNENQLQQYIQSLTDFLCRSILNASGEENGLAESRAWDLLNFAQNNMYRGLNDPLLLRGRQFQSSEFKPQPARLDKKEYNRIKAYTRDLLYTRGNGAPVFQMLYLIMGNEKYWQMVELIHKRIYQEPFSIEFVEKCANEVSPEPLNWFFDYWLRSGVGYPNVSCTKAAGRVNPNAGDNDAQYEVEAVITNSGTGRVLVPMNLKTSKDPIEERIWIGPGETITWRVRSRNLPKFVQVDPEGWIMMAPPEGSSGVNIPNQNEQRNMPGMYYPGMEYEQQNINQNVQSMQVKMERAE